MSKGDPFGSVADFNENSAKEIGDAYRERKGDRPPFDEVYATAYWTARKQGRSIEESVKIAKGSRP